MPNRFHHGRFSDAPSLEYSLVVVHMQPWLVEPHDAVVSGVEKVIRKAIADNVGVVLLEWEGKDPTLTVIRQLLDHYPHWATTYKSDTNGSREVMETCAARGFWLNHLVVCGVALQVCVAATIRGLTGAMPLAKVELIKSATDKPDKRFDWSTYPSQPWDKKEPPTNFILSETVAG